MTPQPNSGNDSNNTPPSRFNQAGPRRGRGGGGPRGGSRGSRTGYGRPSPDRVEPVDKEAPIELEGTVSAVLAGTMFKVKLRNGHEVLAHISGKMRKRFIRLVIGDQVKIEMSPYDADKARIVYRL
ncbi:MAG TPA: translation initiation factor IF-1 [Flavobacteriales bacterium]|jgi:translation initiation factor IF-1|nr:translation initiation factor IF-1 [Flavobacteriales bacterium]